MAGEGKDPPIEKLDYLYGLKVVDIGDIRVARGKSRRPATSCRHLSMVYDQSERRIWCEDCEQNVEPFDALMIISNHIDGAHKKAERLLKEAQEASEFALRSRAAKEIDRQWRRKKMVPACPHCHAGIWPEDAFRMGAINKEWDGAKRRKAQAERATTALPPPPKGTDSDRD